MLLSLRLQFVDFAFNLRSLVLVHNVNIMEDWRYYYVYFLDTVFCCSYCFLTISFSRLEFLSLFINF